MQSLSMEFLQGLGKRVTVGDFIVPQWNRPEAVSYIGYFIVPQWDRPHISMEPPLYMSV